MLRRLALVVALLGPTAGLAQTANQVLITPATFGTADCASTTSSVSISWTSSVTPVTGDIYRVFVSTDSTCPATGTPTNSTQLGSDISATAVTQSYPTGLTRDAFRSASGAVCTANSTLYVCVQHLASGGGTGRAIATGSAKLEVEPPPVPVGVVVVRGDSALFVDWSDGVSNGVAAVSYNVTAVATSDATDTHTQNFTVKNGRVTGLTNGVTYSVTVTSVSAGGNQSGPSTTVATGTPEPVTGFWEDYVAANGHREQGGCGGGPAGLVSMLGVALALAGLRRRS